MFESSFTENGSLGHLFPYFVTSEMALNKEGLRAVFDRIDLDGNGVLDHDELCRGFEERGIVFTSDTITGLMEIADKNGDGVRFHKADPNSPHMRVCKPSAQEKTSSVFQFSSTYSHSNLLSLHEHPRPP